MDINKVVFGNFSVGARQSEAKKSEKREEESAKANVGSEAKNFDAEAVFDALNIAGLQNKAQIAHTEKKEVNPSDYLTEDRISDIEAMMGKFEDGVGKIADAIEAELPGFFAADAKNALAAKIFAQE